MRTIWAVSCQPKTRRKNSSCSNRGHCGAKAGASLVLEPGGAHLMLLGLEDALRAGEELILTLEFANAGAVDVTVPVSANAPVTTGASH